MWKIKLPNGSFVKGAGIYGKYTAKYCITKKIAVEYCVKNNIFDYELVHIGEAKHIMEVKE